MSCYSATEEITPERADFLVERRGFEPLTSAVRALSRAAGLFADAIVCRTATHQHVEMEVRFMLGISTRA
jgi:hypothetical protein